MITSCTNCKRKTRQIDASVYAGDYHSGDLYATCRQCVECGQIYNVQKVGETVTATYRKTAYIPPRKQWEEPLL